MPVIDTLVIGAGHAGLAMSRCLRDRDIDHVVLERGHLGERWRSARWDSFRLLTPNWLTRLPDWTYGGGEPDGFMTSAAFVAYLEHYAASFSAPVREQTTVLEVRPRPEGGYLVRTDSEDWMSTNVVIATGEHATAVVPSYAAQLPPDIAQITAADYRSPGQLPGGAALVVGASASGVQIADELARAGRAVVLAVGRHTRLPRRYRERDIFWWLDRTGSLDRTIEELPDPQKAVREPSLQLSGSGRRVDLAALRDNGVRLVGRLVDIDGGIARFADDLLATTAAADARMRRVLARADEYAGSLPRPPRAQPLPPPIEAGPGPTRLNLRCAGVTTVVWATGFRPAYPWLAVPVLDDTGRIVHQRGVTSAEGLFAIGLRFQHRRSSTFIDGARHDARFVAGELARRAMRVAV